MIRRSRSVPAPMPARPAKVIDLHLHSTGSDGTEAPAALVRRAAGAGIDTLALTDHDSVRGLAEAREACRAAGIGFVPGIELSVGVGRDEIHLLGYGINPRGRSLQRTLELLAGERADRMERMVGRLRKAGIGIALDDVRAVAPSGLLGRLHLARALVARGLAGDHDEVFRRWIGAGGPAYVPRSLLSLRDAIDLVREAGGVAVLAHPGLTRRDELIEYLVRLGVRGLEVFHPRHDFVAVSRYRKTCARFDLFMTGGSDSHGNDDVERGKGTCLTPPDEFKKMLKYIAL